MRLASLLALSGFVAVAVGCQSKELTREAAADLIEAKFEPKKAWEISEPLYQEGRKRGLWSNECKSLGPIPTATPDATAKDDPPSYEWKPPKHEWALIQPGDDVGGCSLDNQGNLSCKGTRINTNKWPIPRGYLSDWSPSGQSRILMVCDDNEEYPECIWPMVIDLRRPAMKLASCDHPGRPIEWVAWSPDEKYAITLQTGEGWVGFCVYSSTTGMSSPIKMGPISADAPGVIGGDVELPTLRWAEDGSSFSVVALRFAVNKKFPPHDQMTDDQQREYMEAVDEAWGAGEQIRLDVSVDAKQAVCRSIRTSNETLDQQVTGVELYPIAFLRNQSAIGNLLGTLSAAEGRPVGKVSFVEPARLEVEVTGITSPSETIRGAEFSWKLPTLEGPLSDLISSAIAARTHKAVNQTGTATFQLYDDGWRVVDVSGMGFAPEGSMLGIQ